MSTPLVEASRVLLLQHYIGSVQVWKADDAAETTIIAVKDPAKDANNTSVYAVSKLGALTYLGTTTRGKDGIVGVTVRNDGTVILWLPEAPLPTDGGTLADLFMVTLQYKLPVEPVVASGTAYNDTALRLLIAGLNIRVTNLETHIAQLDAKLAAAKAAL